MTTQTPNQALIRADGLKLINPLRGQVNALIEVVDEETYLEADRLLGLVKNARAVWESKIAPIIKPIKDAIASMNRSKKAADALDQEVDGPLEAMEDNLKGKMRAYKIKELQEQQKQEEQKRLREAELAEEIKKKAAQADKFKAPMAKAQALQAVADMEQELEEISSSSVETVRGASSTARKTRKWRVVDRQKFLQAVLNGEVPEDVIITNQVVVNQYHKQDPATVEGWPGVEGYDDIGIARR